MSVQIRRQVVESPISSELPSLRFNSLTPFDLTHFACAAQDRLWVRLAIYPQPEGGWGSTGRWRSKVPSSKTKPTPGSDSLTGSVLFQGCFLGVSSTWTSGLFIKDPNWLCQLTWTLTSWVISNSSRCRGMYVDGILVKLQNICRLYMTRMTYN